MKAPYMRRWSKIDSPFSTFRISKRFGLFLACVILAGAAASFAGAAGLPKGEVDSQRNLDAVLNFLRPAFGSKGGPCRISYSTVCARDGSVLPFPKLQVRPPLTDKTGFDTVCEIFRDDKRVKVTRNRSGITTITVGEPPTDILQTRIRRLSLTPTEQYNEQSAIVAVMHTEEFESAERVLGIKGPVSVLAINIVQPTKGLPHLPSSLKNITVDEAFDRIARTFHVAILYASCSPRSKQPRMIMFDSVPLYDALRPPWFPRD
jgi:hypothetical protein